MARLLTGSSQCLRSSARDELCARESGNGSRRWNSPHKSTCRHRNTLLPTKLSWPLAKMRETSFCLAPTPQKWRGPGVFLGLGYLTTASPFPDRPPVAPTHSCPPHTAFCSRNPDSGVHHPPRP